MSIPGLIELVPLNDPVRAEITVPGSKSLTNRALVLAALASGETVLEGALWSEDTQVMVAGLRELGFKVEVEADPSERCNRRITVHGLMQRKNSSGRDIGQSRCSFCWQCGDCGAVFDGLGLPGERRLSTSWDAAHASTAPRRVVPCLARVGL
ncbi:MAG: hypothetical protein M1608_14645 [Candidatus Omnitrophica bacterium]|nr:hypothetical protein [Candidatus Omnitrophota bacterium]